MEAPVCITFRATTDKRNQGCASQGARLASPIFPDFISCIHIPEHAAFKPAGQSERGDFAYQYQSESNRVVVDNRTLVDVGRGAKN